MRWDGSFNFSNGSFSSSSSLSIFFFLSLWGNIKYLETDGVRYALDRMEIKVWMMDGEKVES